MDVVQVLARIKLLDREFHVQCCYDAEEPLGYLLHMTYYEPDVITGVSELQTTRKWFIAEDADDQAIVETAYACALRSYAHVVAEHFTFDGRRVFSPHISLEARAAIVEREKL